MKNRKSVYNDAQSVHDSNVQESIRRSIAAVIKKGKLEEGMDEVLTDRILDEETKRLILEYCDDKTEHSVFLITFEELFGDVWRRIQGHPERDEIKRVLGQEMKDGMCKCFTGRISRLVNCLSGFYEDVGVKIGSSDQIWSIIERVKEKMGSEYDVERHKEIVRRELKEREYEDGVIEEWLVHIE